MGLAVLATIIAALVATMLAVTPALATRRPVDPGDPMAQQSVDQLVDSDRVGLWCFATVAALAAVTSLVAGSPTWPLWIFTTVVLLVAVRLVQRNNAWFRLYFARHGLEPSTGREAEHRQRQRQWLHAGKILLAAAWAARIVSGLEGLEMFQVGHWLLFPASVLCFAIGGWRLLRGPDPHPFFVREK